MPARLLEESRIFPNPIKAEPSGLLAIGGDLSVGRLLRAYSRGVFPWSGPGDPLLWWSPPERALVFPHEERFTNRTRRALRNTPFEVRMDTEFEQVMRHCASVPRPGQDGTWITHGMMKAYQALHDLGLAHSVEVSLDGRLVGGLYGVSLGAAFFGESMFYLVDYASRAAFAALCEKAWGWGFHFIDGQFPNENLEALGAKTISRRDFLDRLEVALCTPTRQGRWDIGESR
jgi:leucyl/phenylalanyl-tRNA--protein transferase